MSTSCAGTIRIAVFALLLGLARNIQPVLLAQPRREWVNQYAQKLHPRIFETAGKTMLVAGTGSIGASRSSRTSTSGQW